MMTETEQLAAFALDPALDHPPAEAARMAAFCLLDFVGCAAGGSQTWMGEAIREYVAEQGGTPEATVVAGGGVKVPAGAAALANGQQGNILDFDDTYLDLGHTGPVVIPAALALGERLNASYPQLRGAIVAGYEVAHRIGLAIRPSDERFRLLYPVGWHSFGATVVAGRLLGLNRYQMMNAFGITAEHAQVATTISTDTVHAFKAGKLGQAGAIGVMAALLAAKGFEGKRTILDADRNLWLALGSDRFAPEALTAGLGERLSILDISFKPFPACRMVHGALGAAAALVAGHELEPERITSATVRSFSRTLQLIDPAPKTAEAVPFSLPFVLALTLRQTPAGPKWSSPETLADPGVLALARKVRVEADNEMDATVDQTGRQPAEVTIRLDDGRVLRERFADAPWGPDDPPDAAGLSAKYLTMAEPVLGGRASVLLRALLHEDSPNLSARTIGELVA
jgi:2-methylcitrate dehydratase PrpD